MTSNENANSSDNSQNDLNSLPSWARELILQLMNRVRELEAQVAKNSSK
ncbi:MAG: hypothetical protein ACI9S8_002285 [Chlamydiales bacterium]|jgi:hypothetical protein